MMTGDIRTIWDAAGYSGDWMLAEPGAGGGLETDAGLETSVILSLATDRLADEADVLPSGDTDRRGHWADAINGYRKGSRLWLLYREKWTNETRLKAETYIREALQWMIDDGVADRIETAVRRTSLGVIEADVTIWRDGDRLLQRAFGPLWNAQL